jgi:hypothetical protein
VQLEILAPQVLKVTQAQLVPQEIQGQQELQAIRDQQVQLETQAQQVQLVPKEI